MNDPVIRPRRKVKPVVLSDCLHRKLGSYALAAGAAGVAALACSPQAAERLCVRRFPRRRRQQHGLPSIQQERSSPHFRLRRLLSAHSHLYLRESHSGTEAFSPRILRMRTYCWGKVIFPRTWLQGLRSAQVETLAKEHLMACCLRMEWVLLDSGGTAPF